MTQLTPKQTAEWVRIRDTARIGNQPMFTKLSVQALDAVEAHMSAMQAAAEVRRGECAWVLEDANEQLYETDCGQAFVMVDSTPKENEMKFCCFCGRTLVEQRLKVEPRMAATVKMKPERLTATVE